MAASDEVRFKPNAQFMGYLWLLVRETTLGKTANDVAQHLLTEELERRIAAGYPSITIRTAEPPKGDGGASD